MRRNNSTLTNLVKGITSVYTICVFVIAIALWLCFLVLTNGFYILIENHSGKRVVVDRMKLGIIPISWDGFDLEPLESFGLPAYKISDYPNLLVVMTDENGHTYICIMCTRCGWLGFLSNNDFK